MNASMINILLHSQQDSKDGAQEEEEKQGENGKKEEEKGRETEGERESEKTDPEMGMCFSAAVFTHGYGKVKRFALYQGRSNISLFRQAMERRRRKGRRAQRMARGKQRAREKGRQRLSATWERGTCLRLLPQRWLLLLSKLRYCPAHTPHHEVPTKLHGPIIDMA